MGPHPTISSVAVTCTFKTWREELTARRNAIRAVLPALRNRAQQGSLAARNAVTYLEGQTLLYGHELAAVGLACTACRHKECGNKHESETSNGIDY